MYLVQNGTEKTVNPLVFSKEHPREVNVVKLPSPKIIDP